MYNRKWNNSIQETRKGEHKKKGTCTTYVGYLSRLSSFKGNEQRISESKGDKGGRRERGEGRGGREKHKGVSVRGCERMCVCVFVFSLGEIFFPPNKKSVRVFFVR